MMDSDIAMVREMLAGLTANVTGMRREVDQHRQEFAEAKTDDRNSRAEMHKHVETLTNRIGTLETSVALIGQVMAQDRDATKANTNAIETLGPTVDQWKRIIRVGYGIVGLLGIGGVGIGASIVWWGDQLATFLRWVLRIH